MEACPNLAEMSDESFLSVFVQKTEKLGIALSASVELTERCNLGCVHCYLGDQAALRHNRERELTTEQWFGILDQLAEMGCLRLLITGGEPLLRRDFADIYRHAKECGLLVTIFTNGTLVTDELIGLFRELPPYAVEITLYGGTAETYEEITGVQGSFEHCMSGVERLKEIGIELGLKTIVMQQNKHELHQIARFARQFGNRKFRFDIEIQGSFPSNNDPLSVRLEPEEGVRLEQEFPEVWDGWEEFIRRRKDLKPIKTEKLYNCGAGKSGLHVNPYGMLQPCLAVRNIGFDLCSGLVSDGVKVIREKLDSMRISATNACNECEDRMVCSACPAFALQETGVEDQPADFQCKVTKIRRQMIRETKGI